MSHFNVSQLERMTQCVTSLFIYLISPSISTLAASNARSPPSQSQGPSLTASWPESRKLLRCTAPTCCCCYEPLEHIPTGFAFVFVFVFVFVFICLCNCNYLSIRFLSFYLCLFRHRMFFFPSVFVFVFVIVVVCICICLLPIKAHTTRVGLCLLNASLVWNCYPTAHTDVGSRSTNLT